MPGVRSVLLPWRLGATPPSLEGSVAWVVGGVGVVGSGICRGLLRAGATVIVNSRSIDRLEGLRNSLGNPERLVTINGSMLAEGAESTVETAMQRCGKLDHVVAHSSVRWWALDSGDDGAMEGELPDPSQKLLEVEPSKFEAAAYKSASLHYGAAFHLLPRMTGGSYTFVTGGSRSLAWGPRGALGQLNTHAVRGLAAALRLDQESRWEAGHSHVDVQELRVGLAFEGQKAALQQVDDSSRGLSGFKLDPRREEPLSQGVGTLCAGILANTAVQPGSPAEPQRPPFDAAADALPHNLRPRPNLLVVSSQDDLASLRKAFPAQDEDFGRFFAPEL